MVLPRSRAALAPLTVTQLTALLRDTLEREIGRVLVAGEISNLRLAGSGHLYFTLKDDRCQVRCVMFRSAAQALVFEPADGQQVIARGQVNLYPARGDLQLYVDTLEPQGRGALQLAFEQLKARLAADGLFDEARKRPLPFLPRQVGIATALGGAALHDMLVMLRQRCPAVRVLVRPVRVQGAGAADDLVEAIGDLNAHPGLEVLIVGRGGGSLEDLWPFNEERVARAIAASRLPIVSAVGHEVDFTIADLVADRRAPTPTAAAELVVPRRSDLLARVGREASVLASTLTRAVARERARVLALARRLVDPRRRAQELRARVERAETRLGVAMRRRLDDARIAAAGIERRLEVQHPAARAAAHVRTVAALARRLEIGMRHVVAFERERSARAGAALHGLSPLAVLQRGYSLTRRLPERTIVRASDALAPGDEVEITFAAGSTRARVEESRRS